MALAEQKPRCPLNDADLSFGVGRETTSRRLLHVRAPAGEALRSRNERFRERRLQRRQISKSPRFAYHAVPGSLPVEKVNCLIASADEYMLGVQVGMIETFCVQPCEITPDLTGQVAPFAHPTPLVQEMAQLHGVVQLTQKQERTTPVILTICHPLRTSDAYPLQR